MDLLETKEISETRGGKSSTHRVGPLAGLCAVIFWGAAFAFIISTVAFSTMYWKKQGSVHVGLWRYCAAGACGNTKDILTQDWFKVIQALVTLSFIASFASVVLAIIYTFVHSLNKSVMLLLIMIIAAAAAVFMVSGAIYFIAKIKSHFGVSFYLGGVAGVTDVVVAIVAFLQKQKSEA